MTYLLKLLHLRRNEVPRLGLAAALFFLGQIDDGIIKSVASAVFNIRAGVDKLPLMYIWIAVLFSVSRSQCASVLRDFRRSAGPSGEGHRQQ